MRNSNSMFILMKLKTRKNMMKIKIQEIKDRGNDEERIVLRVLEDCNLCRYLVLDTTFDKDGNISNKNRHVYAFGDVPVRKGDYVVLYTKVGNDLRQTNANGTTSYFFYWNMLNYIWNNERDIAFLVHYDEWDRLESKD